MAASFLVDMSQVNEAIDAVTLPSESETSGKPVDPRDRKSKRDQIANERKKNKKKHRKGETIGLKRRKDPQLCHYLAEGTESPATTGRCCGGRIETCRRSTDTEGFLKERGPRADLPCPVYETSGHCPQGLNCSFASCLDESTSRPRR